MFCLGCPRCFRASVNFLNPRLSTIIDPFSSVEGASCICLWELASIILMILDIAFDSSQKILRLSARCWVSLVHINDLEQWIVYFTLVRLIKYCLIVDVLSKLRGIYYVIHHEVLRLQSTTVNDPSTKTTLPSVTSPNSLSGCEWNPVLSQLSSSSMPSGTVTRKIPLALQLYVCY